MAGLRRALLFASGGRYLVMGVNLVSATVLARLLTPSEFGISVLGTSLLGVAEAIRELGSTAYLVQQKDLTRKKIRTVFTVSLIVTLTMSALLVMLSDVFARFYGVPELARYVQIIALSYVIAPFSHPIYAVLSRDMKFGKLALLDTLAMLVGALASVVLVLQGFSYLSLAWATVLSAATWTLLGLYVGRDFSVYRPSLSEWRSVLAFGAYGSATAVLYRSSESLFWLILGKMLDARAVGLGQRALTLSQFPERVVLAGIGAVALPAFSDHARQGRALKEAYLGALEHMTAVQWPALTLLAIMAEPIVLLLYGSQWRDAIPIVRIFAVALMLNFPTALNYPIQVAVGAIRDTVPLAFAQTAVSLVALTFAAHYGIRAVALSTFITVPLNVGLSVLVVRAHVPFRWSELAGAIMKSAVVAGLTAMGPLAVIACCGTIALTVVPIAMAVGLGGVGWLAGLWLTHHPLFREVRNVAASIAKFVAARLGVVSWPFGGGPR
jgi:O-antigen/teichoic acid export membrane protein